MEHNGIPSAQLDGNAQALLDRGFLALEDGKWDSADGFFEQALNYDAKLPQAYLGKLMAELKVSKQDDLKNCSSPFDGRANYQKALRFADPAFADTLQGYIAHINERNKKVIYDCAVSAMRNAKTEAAYRLAADTFKSVQGFEDADALAKQCFEKAEICRKDAVYSTAKSKMIGEKVASYEEATKVFRTISGWKDSDEQIYACQKKIEEIKAKEEADRLEAQRKAEERRIAAEKAAKKRKKAFAIGTPIVAACIAFLIVLTTVIIPNNKYNSAVALMNNKEYDEAITAFEALNGYKDSTDKISLCKTALKDIDYNTAVSLMDACKYDEAVTAFEALNGYKDSTDKISLCKTALKDIDYNTAVSLMDACKYDEAVTAFEALNGYKDSKDKASECLFLVQKSNLSGIKKGDTVKFGFYEQDNNTTNGKEEIEWIVLNVEDNKALVISKYALDCRQYNTSYYNTSYTDVTWEKCSLRKWLNDSFLNTAFGSKHQEQISSVSVSADKNPKYSTKPGNATTDKVFLLSITEAEKYFSSDSARQCSATAYAKAQGYYTSTSNGNCWWWLRSPGYYQDIAAFVFKYGSVSYRGDRVSRGSGAVRPALWINLDS